MTDLLIIFQCKNVSLIKASILHSLLLYLGNTCSKERSSFHPYLEKPIVYHDEIAWFLPDMNKKAIER